MSSNNLTCKTQKQLAIDYGVGYTWMKEFVNGLFPNRPKGILKPHEVKKVVEVLEEGADPANTKASTKKRK